MNTIGLPYESMIKNIQNELESYLLKSGLKSLVIGISGGIDSAICAALARPVCDKLGIPLIGRSIPITGNASDERDRAELVGKAFCTNFDESYQVEGAFGATWSAIKAEGWEVEDPNEKIRMGNVKARMRMIALYDLAQIHKGMVLSTDNYTEFLLGFWTLHGDVGDYGMIQNLWKTEVYDMSEYLVDQLPGDQARALQLCIHCQATDGLGISKTDLDQIMPGWEGSSREGYKKVDKILFSYLIGIEEFEGGFLEKHPVIKRHLATRYKRENPLNIRRSIILPPKPKKYEKKEIIVTVHSHNGDKPYTKGYLDDLDIQPEDRVNIEYREEEYRSDGGSPAGWYIEVTRTRLETDKEFKERVEMEERWQKNLKKRRYENYLKLKEEFEK